MYTRRKREREGKGRERRRPDRCRQARSAGTAKRSRRDKQVRARREEGKKGRKDRSRQGAEEARGEDERKEPPIPCGSIISSPGRQQDRQTDKTERLSLPVRLEMTGRWLNRSGYSFSFDPQYAGAILCWESILPQLVAFVALLPPSGRLPASPAADEDGAFTSLSSTVYIVYLLAHRPSILGLLRP